VDDGPTGRLTPFLVPDGVFPADQILTRFKEAAIGLPEEVKTTRCTTRSIEPMCWKRPMSVAGKTTAPQVPIKRWPRCGR
jgi:hypothetical protein